MALLLSLASNAIWGQVDSTHFLWYTGHWSKTKKNVFVINRNSTPGGAGGLSSGGTGGGGAGEPGGTGAGNGDPATGNDGGAITIGPDGSVSISGAAIDAWNKRVDEQKQMTDQYIQQLDNPGDNLDPATHRLFEMLRTDAVAKVQELEASYIIPNQFLIGIDGSASSITRDQLPDYCQKIKSQYDEVINYYKDHVKGHEHDLNVPNPPRFDYDCFTCDSNVRKSYDTTIAHYVRDFMHPEDSIIREGNQILLQLAVLSIQNNLMTGSDYDAFFAKNKNDPSKSASCSYMQLGLLATAVYETIHHLYLRADKLVEKNRNDFKSIDAVQAAYVEAARLWEMATGGHSGFDDVYKDLKVTRGKALDHYVDALRYDDWKQIGNFTYTFDLFREFALMGGADRWEESMAYLTKLQQMFNGFKLTIEMDIKTGNANAYRLAHVKGECFVIPEFRNDSNQCYRWVVADENRQDIHGFYLRKDPQTIDCKVIANEMVSPPQAPKLNYTGTRNYTAQLVGLRMDFCNPGHDTIFLSGFTPNPADAGLWTVPYSPPVNMGLNGQEQYFESIADRKKLQQSGEVDKQADELKQSALKLKEQMEAMKQAGAFRNAGTANGQNAMEKVREMRQKMADMVTNPTLAKMLYIDFLLPVQNNQPKLVERTFDAREINPMEANVIIYGRYTILIENDANGKTKKIPQPPIHVDNTIKK